MGNVVHQVVEKRALVLTTEQHMLAALCPRTGDILWKYKFTPEDSVVGEPLLSGDNIVTFHGSGNFRQWDIATGN